MSKNADNLKLVPLFGRTDDMRVKLFINELRDQAVKVSGSYTTLQIKTVTPVFQNMYFKTPTKNTSFAADVNVHSEWEAFASHFANRMDGKVINATAFPDALAVIKSVGGIPASGSEQQFAQALVQAVVSEISVSGSNITKMPSQWNTATSAKFKTKAELAKLFTESATSKNPIDALSKIAALATTADDTKVKEFGYRYDKYWLVASASTSVAASKFFDDVAPTGVEEYIRKGTELYKRDATGKETRVDLGSDLAKALSVDVKCMGTGLDDAKTTEKCADYLRDCLSGNDVTKCKDFLAKPDFWINAENEVDNMLPAMAIKTLNAFEFGMEQVWDTTANRRLLKYKSTTSWIEGLTEIAKAAKSGAMSVLDVEAIAKNSKLIGYLNMLVKKVNSSPSILNKDYVGKTITNVINNPDAFTGSRLHRMGVKARLATNNLSVSSVDKLSQAIKDSNSRVSITLGLPGLHGFASRFSLSGGANTMEALEEKVSDETKQTAYIIEAHFVSLNSRLKKHGKEISKSDADKILNLLESLKKSEDKLNKAMLYTEKYTRLLEVHGQRDNTDILSMDHLKQFVDNRNKYFARVSKKQNDLMSIIRSIAEAVNKETPSADAEMSSIDVDAKSVNINSLLG